MNFWWVNHKQTAKAELGGGYIWSPKRNKRGRPNWSYDNLTAANVGDIVFSYAGAAIGAVGVISQRSIDAVRPEEFGRTGEAWDALGWLVKVDWTHLAKPIRPKDHLVSIAPLLPSKYSPIRPDGDGNQGCYLAQISVELGNALLGLTTERPLIVERAAIAQLEATVEKAEAAILTAPDIPETEKEQLIKARKGQGKFRLNVEKLERACRLTGVADTKFLIASHIKPWQSSSNEERLDGNNGLLLSPHIDRLFDKGWISFSDNGEILVSDPKIAPVLSSWHVNVLRNVGRFNEEQRKYLEYHRRYVFKNG